MWRFLVPVSALLVLACAGSTPGTTFSVSAEQSDASCSKALDFCLRVSCTVRNDGSLPGQAVVDLQVLGKDGAPLHTHTERVELGPGDTKTLSHDFAEVKLAPKERNGRCVLR